MTPGVRWCLEGWGDSREHPGRRGGFWSIYSFETLKEAKREQKKQLKDQAWKKAQKLRELLRWRSKTCALKALALTDFDKTFPIFKVTTEQVTE